jgi:hypothetical protein
MIIAFASKQATLKDKQIIVMQLYGSSSKLGIRQKIR